MDEVVEEQAAEKPELSPVNDIVVEEQPEAERKEVPPEQEEATGEAPVEPKPYDVLKAENPRWDQPEHKTITLTVLFYCNKDTLGPVPFTASPDDREPHGRDLFARAKDGAYGDVAEPSSAQLAGIAKFKLSGLQSEANAKVAELTEEVATLQDAVDLEMATDEEAARLPKAKTELTAWKKYRVLLGRVEAQPGFPATITWPERPA